MRAAVRRGVLLLATGGDPRREIDLEGRAVLRVAADLDGPGRRGQLVTALAALQRDAAGLPNVSRALERLVRHPDVAWRAYAASLLAEELAE